MEVNKGNKKRILNLLRKGFFYLVLTILLSCSRERYPWFRWGFYVVAPGRDLYDVCFYDSTRGWAVGDDGIILEYREGSWEVESESLWVQGSMCSYLSCVKVIDTNDVWAGGTGKLLHYDGRVWDVVREGSFVIEDMDFWGNGYGMAVGRSGVDGYVLEYRDGEWKEIDAPELYLWSVSVVGDGKAWVSAGEMDTCKLYYYKDGEWEIVELPEDYTVFDIDFVSEDEGYGVEWDGVVMHYHRGKWEFQDSLYVIFWRVDFIDGSHGIAVGDNSVCQYRDGWRKVYFPTLFMGVDYIGGENVWIDGIGGIMMYGIPEEIEGEWREKGIDDRRMEIERLR